MSAISRLFGIRIASPVLSGLIWSFIWLGIGALFLSFLLASTSVKEDGIPSLAIGIHGFASLCGGFVSARRAGRRGWYFGFVNGLLYTLLILLTSFLATDIDWTLRVLVVLGLTSLTGAFGGMLGVNSGGSSRVR
ncbi:TIGR04086 family membrane protein [Cohnella faecalis]|uniref:TIGR04086 family membrane protein n=1 Tax=Cohnella faecalis TaxID=2315694 RepID=A0A398CDM6_9BACL|nr:TIGR04086 family membrane protein [Cohnella faecalis]RIE00535.1 TIGR04086 family membrane protein [Cohnella faecalis]